MKKVDNVEDKGKDIKSNTSGRGRRNNYKGRSKRKTKSNSTNTELKPTSDDINDSSYYYNDKTVLEQITNYSFNQFAGVRFLNTYNDDSSRVLAGNVSTIMRIEIAPSAGAGGSFGSWATDGVQRAGLKNYVTLSASNAKTTNYQPMDITMLIFALSSIMEQLSQAQRILGCLNVFNVRNRDLPQMLVEAQGVQYSDLSANYADYVLEFNNMLTLLNKVPIPSAVKAFMKSSAMFSNIYTDDTSPMCQMFIPVSDGYWTYDEANQKLAYTKISYATPINFGVYLNRIKAQINAILNSATFNYIYADILRLAEKSGLKLLMYTTIPLNYVAPILYSNEFNLWINNLTIIGSPTSTVITDNTAGNDVTQDILANKILYKPAVDGTAWKLIPRSYLVNFDENGPDIESKIAATRLLSAYRQPLPGQLDIICGTHFVTQISTYQWDAHSASAHNWITINNSWQDANNFATASLARVVNALTKFKHACRLYIADPTDSTNFDISIVGDLDFYTEVDANYLARMFDLEWINYLTIG